MERARERMGGRATVHRAGAAALPLPDAGVDLVHARTAYFFGPGCEPGLAEAQRVLRPGGAIAIVDLDATVAPYGDWMRADIPRYDPDRSSEFFERQGFSLRRIATTWRFPDRATLEAVLRIEFSRRWPSGRSPRPLTSRCLSATACTCAARKPVTRSYGQPCGHRPGSPRYRGAMRATRVPYLEPIVGAAWWTVGAAALDGGFGTVVLAVGLGVMGMLVMALRRRIGGGEPLPRGGRSRFLRLLGITAALVAVAGTALGRLSWGELTVPVAAASSASRC